MQSAASGKLGPNLSPGDEEPERAVLVEEGSVASPSDEKASAPSGDAAPAKVSPPTTCQKVTKQLIKWHLPIGLVAMVLLGWLVPASGRDVGSKTPLSTVCVVVIFLISGLKLKTEEIRGALRARIPLLYGIVAILGLTSLLAFALVRIPIGGDKSFSNGQAMFAVMPTTISSGMVLTAQAGGNFSLALMLTVATNLLSVVTVPVMLSLVLDMGGTKLDVGSLLGKLCLTLLLPLLVGKALRSYVKRVEAFVDKHSLALKLVSSFFLVLIPWMRVAQSEEQLRSIDAAGFGTMLLLGAAMHLVFLVFNTGACYALCMPREERIAVTIMGSQKTLGVAVAVIDLLPPSAGSQGLIIIPCILSHFSQIIIDAFLAVYFAGAGKRQQRAEAERGLQRREAEAAPGKGGTRSVELAGQSAATNGVVVDGGSGVVGGKGPGGDLEAVSPPEVQLADP